MWKGDFLFTTHPLVLLEMFIFFPTFFKVKITAALNKLMTDNHFRDSLLASELSTTPQAHPKALHAPAFPYPPSDRWPVS